MTRPLAPAVIEALHRAVDNQAAAETFHGCGPSGEGYIRLTAFGDAEDTRRAVGRIRDLLG